MGALVIIAIYWGISVFAITKVNKATKVRLDAWANLR